MADNLRKYTTQEVLNKVYTDSSGNAIGVNSSTTKETLNAVFSTSDNSLNVALSGGTISGDVTIEGDLTVNGDGTLAYDEIIEGTSVIRSNNGNASQTLLTLHNNDEPSGGETGQTADIEFQFQGTTNSGSSFVTKNAGAIRAGKDTDYNTASADNMDSHLKFYTAQDNVNTLALTIDSNQNIGLGVTPESSWQSSYTALQLSNSVLYNNGGNDLFLGANFYFDGSNNKYITADGRASAIGLADGALKFFVSSSTTHSADDNVSFNQALTITNSGEIGIGVSSPESNLSFEPALVTASTEGIKFQNAGDDNDAIIQPWRFASGMGMVLGSNFFLNTSGAVARFKDADESVGVLLDPRGTFDIYTGASGADATSKLRIDNSGNVGIGKTSLESTDSNWRSLELGGNGALINHSASGAGKAFIVSQNAYMVSNNFNTGMDYMDTDEASCYLQHSGTHTFRVASSGTADASITWTDALAIDNSANATFSGDVILSKATNSAIYQDDSSEFLRLGVGGSGNDTPRIEIFGKDYGGANAGGNIYIVSGGDGSATSGDILLGADQGAFAEHMRITNSGNVGIGTTSPSANLDFGATSNNSQVINLRKNSTSVTGLGVNDNYGVRIAGPSDSSMPVSFGEISTSDGTTFTERMRIDSSGNVGIGGSPTESRLEVLGTSGELSKFGTLTNDWSANHTFGLADGNGIMISKINEANNTATNRVLLLKRDDTSGGIIFIYDNAGNANIRLDSEGINFPDGSPSSSDANTLDDYEEGAGTPTVSLSGSGSVTLGPSPTTAWTKVGNIVSFQFEFSTTAHSSPVGTLQVALPFTSAANYYSAGSLRVHSETFDGSPFLQITPSSNVVQFQCSKSGSGTTAITPTSGTRYYFGQITYRAA